MLRLVQVKVPARSVQEEVLCSEEIKSVLEDLWWNEEWFYPCFALWVSTGLRNAEVIGLTWDCVRLDEEELLISKTLRRDGTATHQRLWSSTKTGKATWAPKSLSHPAAGKVFRRYISNHGLANAEELGKKIAGIHWKQLGALLSWTPVTTGVTKPKAAKKQPPASIVVQGAEIQTMKGKAVRVLWDSKRIWLPKSQINVNSETGDITMPKWLARNKGMIAAPAAGTPTVGGEESDDGFDWDGWKNQNS